MKKEEFADRLSCACASVISAEQELTEIDSHFVDADHGLTMKKTAGAIDSAVKGSDGGIKEMLDDAAMAVMVLNGGSAVPLWNAGLDRMQEGAPEGDEIDVSGIKAIFKRAFEELDSVSGAKVGDKTMMDALIPASEAIASYKGSDENELLPLPPKQPPTAPRQAGSLFPSLEGPKATGPRPSEPPTWAQYPWRISFAAWPGLKCNGIH